MVSQNKDNQLHISTTIFGDTELLNVFNFHFAMDCKNNYNCNCLGITLSFPRSLSHLFAAFSTNKRNTQINVVSVRSFFQRFNSISSAANTILNDVINVS